MAVDVLEPVAATDEGQRVGNSPVVVELDEADISLVDPDDVEEPVEEPVVPDDGVIRCNGLEATIIGTDGDDVIEGTFRDDVIAALGGDDIIRGGSGADTICGGDGADRIFGQSQDDEIFGEDGDDVLNGDSGADLLRGGEGSDTLNGGSQADTLHGGNGDDELNGDAGADTLDGGNGTDVLDGGFQTDSCDDAETATSCETQTREGEDGVVEEPGSGAPPLCAGLTPSIVGTPGDDVIEGTFADDVIVGLGGNDTIRGGSGADTICGGDGNDRIFGQSQGDIIFGEGGDDVINGNAGADTIDGGEGNDTLSGDAQDDRLDGGVGDDRLNGGAGADLLDGGNGTDILDGGFQADVCLNGEENAGCEETTAADGDGAAVAMVNVLPLEAAAQVSPFSAAAAVGFEDANGGEVEPTQPFELSLDLSDVALNGGAANLYERLTVTRYDRCEVFGPSDEALAAIAGTEIDPESLPGRVICESFEELDADFDTETRMLTAMVDVEEIEETAAEREAALVADGVDVAGLNPKNGEQRSAEDIDALAASGNAESRDLENPGLPNSRGRVAFSVPAGSQVFAQAGGGTTGSVYGVTSGASSSSGDFSALPVPTLTDAQVGLYTGSAETSYPIPVPPAAAGPEPSVSLVYSSAGIDGMTVGTNNQAGPIGLGWSLAVGGSIQRQLAACNQPQAAGDRCISSEPDDSYSMSLGGYSSNLVRIDGGNANTNPKEFRLESDPFWRIRLWEGNGETNPTFNNEWWSVETPDGTIYRLGTSDDSVDWLPVYQAPGCTQTNDLCNMARQWNVTTVTDVFFNEMTYEYNQEMNYYNARSLGTNNAWPYVRASQIETITYGGNGNSPANARIVFNWEQRCGQSSTFGACPSFETNFHDAPDDLWCGPHAEADEYSTMCTENAPTFWTLLRLGGIVSQVANGTDWVTVAHHDPNQTFTRDGSVPLLDSELQLVLNGMAERPVETDDTPFEFNGFDPLWARNRTASNGPAFIDSHDIGTEQTVTGFNDADWIRFSDVWMGGQASPASEVTIRMSAVNTGTIEIFADGINGTPLATLNINSSNFTNGPNDYATFTLPIASANQVNGVRQIFVRSETATNTSAGIGNVSLIQFGRPDIGALPSVGTVTYDGGAWEFLDNRLNHPAGVSAMRMPRIEEVQNQLGGVITFDYSIANPCAPNVEVPPSSGTWALNDLDCFPQWDASSDNPQDYGFAIFNKWTVSSVQRISGANQPVTQIDYTYESPGWGYVENPDVSSSFLTWNEFRGYARVVADTVGTGQTETRFHQGLHGEPLSPVSSGNTRSVTSQRSTGNHVADHYALRGQVFETRQLNDSNGEISRSWTWYRNLATVSGNSDRTDPRFVAPSNILNRTDQNNADRTRTLFTYNDWGQPSAVRENGDLNNFPDDRTTVTSFYPANTGAAIGAWRSPMPCVTALRAGNDTSAPSASSAAGFVRWQHNAYDGETAVNCSGSVDEPVVTRSSVANTATGRLITNFRLDSRGRVDRVVDPNGRAYTTVFDPVHGQITSTINPLAWNTAGTYDLWRRPLEQTDVNGRRTQTFYDAYSRVVAVRDELGIDENRDTVRYIYDQTANPSTVRTRTIIDGNSFTDSAVFYDGFGRQVLTRTFAPDVNFDWVTAQQYDTAGRMRYSSAQYQLFNGSNDVTQWDAPDWTTIPSVSETVYDQGDRVIRNRTRDGSTGTIEIESEISYDGLTTRFTDPNGQWTDTTTDGHGRVIEVAEQFGATTLDTTSVYNAADDLTRAIGPDGEITDITYDLAGRKLTVDDPDSHGLWEYGYDANSNLISETDPSNSVTTFRYDNLNRVDREWVDGTLRGVWFYDPANNLGSLRQDRQYLNNGEGIVFGLTFYDDYGRVTEERTLIPDADSTARLNFRSRYTHLDNGQISTIDHPTSTSYATNHRVVYDYNLRTGTQAGLEETANSGGETIVESVKWSQTGQVFEHNYGPDALDARARWQYDPTTLRLHLEAFGTVDSVGRDRVNYYQYDNTGNIEVIWERQNSEQRQCFSYDQLDRLTSAFTDNTHACNGHTPTGQGNYDDTYTYDIGGNLLSHTGTGEGTQRGNYTYNDGDLAHAVTAISDNSTFAYDANGDMTNRSLEGQPNQTLVWDEGRRLEEVNEGNTTVAEFLYAIDDTRVRRVTDDGTATYYLADGTEYTEGPNGDYFTYYHQMNGKMVAFTRSDTDVTTWMGSDIVNSTPVTRDENGVTATQRYTPFGELRNHGNLETDHLFTGQVLDESSGLAFYNARYYDPAIGRFITPDSIVPNPRNGQDYNRYTYVRNNPTRYNDPTGNEPCRRFERVECTHNGFDGDIPAIIASTNQRRAERSQAPTNSYVGHISAAEPGATADCNTARCLAETVSIAPVPYVSDASDVFLCGDSIANRGGVDRAIDCGSALLPLAGAGFVRKLFGRWLPTGAGSQRIALGLGDDLGDFASTQGAITYRDFPGGTGRFADDFLELAGDPSNDVLFNLDGIRSPLSSVQRAGDLTLDDALRAGASITDWELAQIYRNNWTHVQFFENGVPVPSPFG